MSAFALSQSAIGEILVITLFPFWNPRLPIAIIVIRIGSIAVGFSLSRWSDYLRSPTSDIVLGVFERRSFNNMHWLSPIAISYRIGAKGKHNIADSDILLGLIASEKIKGPLNSIPLNHCDMQSCDRFIEMIRIICFAFFIKRPIGWFI